MLGSLFCTAAQALGGCRCDLKLPAGYPVYMMPWQQMVNNLRAAGLTGMVKDTYPPDGYAYFTDSEHLEKLFRDYIYSAEMFAYYERRDCDNYTKKAIGNFEFDTGLTGLQLNGYIPGDEKPERHAWAGVWTLEGLRMWDPNAGFKCAGELLKTGNAYGWEPDAWK